MSAVFNCIVCNFRLRFIQVAHTDQLREPSRYEAASVGTRRTGNRLHTGMLQQWYRRH